jgi:hypothetical protein
MVPVIAAAVLAAALPTGTPALALGTELCAGGALLIDIGAEETTGAELTIGTALVAIMAALLAPGADVPGAEVVAAPLIGVSSVFEPLPHAVANARVSTEVDAQRRGKVAMRSHYHVAVEPD